MNRALAALSQLVKIVVHVNLSTNIPETKEISGTFMVGVLSDRNIDLVSGR